LLVYNHADDRLLLRHAIGWWVGRGM
jgi:hypothetical protein